ncbi:hypothetical protein LJB42_003858 [Komagataella kurtzmanii]|nr:hypothetical protein LJB42_003858 [Komagataella kurtzmanii]
MSNQSGIEAGKELIQSFNKFYQSGSRALTLKIQDEQIVVDKLIEGTSSFKQDFALIREALSDVEPRYVIIKNDEIDKHTFISYVPDNAKVRDKMLYASTKTTLIRELGLEYFFPIAFVSDLDEVSYEGWQAIKAHESEQQPLTQEEESLKLVKDIEDLNLLKGGGTSRKFNLAGFSEVPSQSTEVAFEVEDEVKEAILKLKNNQAISATISNERVVLLSSKSLSNPKELTEFISSAHPSYAIHQGDEGTSFIYACPSGSKVKDRMLHATNKKGFTNFLKANGINLDKIIEINDVDELDLYYTDSKPEASTIVHEKTRFTKPRGPRRR